MFSNAQIRFMREHGITVDFNKPLSDDDFFKIDDVIADLLQIKGFDSDYEPTAKGTMCESILDTLAEM